MVGDPLEWLVNRVAGALAMVAEVEREDIEAKVTERVGVVFVAPPVAQEFVAEDQHACTAPGPCPEVAAREVETVGRGELDLFAIVRGARRSGQNIGFSSKPRSMIGV